ncbi:MAG: GxxExxY protein [bacterium]
MEKRDPKTYEIIGAAMDVHRTLGCGFLEAVYQEALAIEFVLQKIPFQKEVNLPIHYKGKLLQTSYRADFICFEEIVVELKALNQISGQEESQLINYLKATDLRKGLLLNFGVESLEYKRLVLNL